jgi:hypothetical protein
LSQTERERVPIMEAFQTTPAKRGLFIGLGVMLLQQFSGCNAVIFYATFIFKVRHQRGYCCVKARTESFIKLPVIVI